jgi:uncharacterized protein
MAAEVPPAVRDYLQSHSTMTLATSGGDRPWAATVFYVCDEELRLYFVSSTQSRHSEQAAANPNVAATIYEHEQEWSSIRGVQIEGRLGVVAAADRAWVEELYARRFPAIGRILAEPADELERLIGERFRAGAFYVLSPGLLRFVDNTQGFGHTDEYVLDERSLHR